MHRFVSVQFEGNERNDDYLFQRNLIEGLIEE